MNKNYLYLTLIILFVLCIGVAVGIGSFTFYYAHGVSYLSNDPKSCVNCHIMEDQYASWKKSSHKHVAVCNDCHTPDGLIGKYYTKALNGWNRSYAFTAQNFPEPIRINERNLHIAANACMKCHQKMWDSSVQVHHEKQNVSCLQCHQGVGH